MVMFWGLDHSCLGRLSVALGGYATSSLLVLAPEIFGDEFIQVYR